jgi:hypothetical protein
MLTQALAYKGILESQTHRKRLTTETNLSLTRDALAAHHNDIDTDETIWKGLHNSVLRIKTHQFLYKAMHRTQKIGNYWNHIPGYEE